MEPRSAEAQPAIGTLGRSQRECARARRTGFVLAGFASLLLELIVHVGEDGVVHLRSSFDVGWTHPGPIHGCAIESVPIDAPFGLAA